MEALGCKPSQAELDFMIKKVDTDGSGEIDFDEFLLLMKHMVEEQDNEAGMIEAFKVFDRD